MAVLFSPDVCLPSDPAGWGRWLLGHAAEHEQMRQILVQEVNPPIIIPDYNIRAWSDGPKAVQTWLQTHQFMHDALDHFLNVTGTDFSLVDFTSEEQFDVWLDDHRSVHAIYRQILGIS